MKRHIDLRNGAAFRSLLFSFLFIATGLFGACSGDKGTTLMRKSAPVWAEGREKEMNLNLGFRGTFTAEGKEKTLLRIAASTLYRVYVNGEFVGSGPARAGHGYYRVDEYDVGRFVNDGGNVVAIEVAGYNLNTYYTLDQPSFLQAEVEQDGNVVLATGGSPGFEAFVMKERLQKVERYSFQRPFTEYYRMSEGYDRWRSSSGVAVESVKLAVYPAVNLLPRHVLLPDFTLLEPVNVYAKGTFTIRVPERYYRDRSLVNISGQFKGYPESELEEIASQRIQEVVTAAKDEVNQPFAAVSPLGLKEGEFYILDFGVNYTGFIGARVRCTRPAKIYFHFDEMLVGGDVNSKKRMADVNNEVVYELQPGVYDLESLEAYTLKFLKIIAIEGEFEMKDAYIREFAYPDIGKAAFASSNPKLNEIYDAAWQTFRQNSLDVFMDCPSRERAGWLCDSYFTGIMEQQFTGEMRVAHNFYENYALPETFEFLPEGMIPMCYPADHNDGVFIPNWAMWFIIQVDDYVRRGGDPQLAVRLKGRIEKLLGYFSVFENEDGLLEKLDSWIMVEWSKAGEYVQDVNYPTNMLYSAALASAANLYGNAEWKQKSEHIAGRIREQSFNGEFFVDNAVREDGKLNVTRNTTEVCQYYAFFFNIATPESHPELWEKMTTVFGPGRDDKTTYPNVAIANAFIGNYMRMDILSRYGLQTQLLSEIQDYFYSMAEHTGTLWENMTPTASCNHGFASYIAHVLYRDVLGIARIDYPAKEITVRFTDIDLEQCNGTIPVGKEEIGLSWKRIGDEIRYTLLVPKGFRVNLENRSSAEPVKEQGAEA